MTSQRYRIPCGDHSLELELDAHELRDLGARKIAHLQGVICPTCGDIHRVSVPALLAASAERLRGAAAEARKTAEVEELARVEGDRRKVRRDRVEREVRRRTLEVLASNSTPLELKRKDAEKKNSRLEGAPHGAGLREGVDRTTPPPIPPDRTGVTDTTGGLR